MHVVLSWCRGFRGSWYSTSKFHGSSGSKYALTAPGFCLSAKPWFAPGLVVCGAEPSPHTGLLFEVGGSVHRHTGSFLGIRSASHGGNSAPASRPRPGGLTSPYCCSRDQIWHHQMSTAKSISKSPRQEFYTRVSVSIHRPVMLSLLPDFQLLLRRKLHHEWATQPTSPFVHGQTASVETFL